MRFHNLPIKQKIRRVILLACMIVLVVSGISSVILDLLAFRQTNIEHLTAIGKIVASNSTAALAFDSEEEANDILSSLISDERIKVAYLYDANNNLFSEYQVDGHAIDVSGLDKSQNYVWHTSYLVAIRPVVHNQRKLGTLYIASDISSMLMSRLKRMAVRSVIIILISLLLTYLLAYWLQKQISKPILSLASLAKTVSEKTDYSVRATKVSNDEIGLLTDAFNQMLTEIQHQNHAIQENEIRLRAVLNSSLTAVILVNEKDEIIEWNEMAEKIFGWKKEEAFGQSLETLIIPSHYRKLYQKRFKQYMTTGKSLMLNRLNESVVMTRDHSLLPVEFSVNTIKVNGDNIFCGFIREISVRKEAEQRIQAQLAKLGLLSDITRAIGDRLDLTSIFQVVIQSLENYLPVDFACMGLVDNLSQNLVIKSIGKKSLQLYEKAFGQDGSLIDIEKNSLTKGMNGVLIYEPDIRDNESPFIKRLADAGLGSLVVSPLKTENGVLGMLFTGRKHGGFTSTDTEFLFQLSEHVSLAVNQANLHSDLQRAYDDLRQTQQAVMQQERLRALGQMSSGIAHDINNAISPIALYTETILENEHGLSENGRKYLEIIQQAIEDVSQTVARMREFYRKREPEITLGEVNLNKLIKQVMDLTRAKWSNIPQEKGTVINMQLDLLPEIPAVLGIEGELREAFTNLVFNAVDAMPDGGQLTIRTNLTEKPFDPKHARFGRFVVMELEDTGIGMDEETRKKCLEPFYTTKGERGTGLGLAMVYGAIKRHNADMEIDSTLGKGTVIRLIFSIPVHKQVENVIGGRVNIVPSLKKILIIDDDPLLLRSLNDSLNNDGHVIVTASGGEEGIKAFKKAMDNGGLFDIVITDLGMPYMDGRKVAVKIKEFAPSVPVILLTGWGQSLLDEGDIPPSVDRVLSKPPKLRELRESIYDLTENSGYD
ncbi:MAG: PAS domain S-box protein [Marinoscillum sp.]